MSQSIAKTDASTDVVFRVKAKKHGFSEFSSSSNSIVRASFTTVMEIFQFYINCDKSFKVLNFVIDNARQRGRSDIVQECVFDLSVLTKVNTYDKI